MSWRDTLETFILEKLSVTKYHKHYKVTVMALKGDVADVLPESDDIKGLAGLQNVPVYWGTPGVKATIAPGATATLFFEDGEVAYSTVAVNNMNKWHSIGPSSY